MHTLSRRQLLAASAAGGLLMAPSFVDAQSKPFRPRPASKFVNFVKYADLDRIAKARQAHFAYADRLREQGKLAIGGPLIDDRGQRIGLLFIYEAGSRDEALSFMREDPFAVANALQSFEISEWRLRGVNLDLLAKAKADRDAPEGGQIKLFANYSKYAPDKSKLASVRPAHWDYDRRLKSAGKLALAGPLANDDGGLFVYNAASREEALALLGRDPFSSGGVFKESELLEWQVEGVNLELLVSDF